MNDNSQGQNGGMQQFSNPNVPNDPNTPNTQNNSNKSWTTEYYEAIKAGFWRVWHNRYLWFWGLFLPAGAGMNNNFNFGAEEESMDFEKYMGDVSNFLNDYLTWIVLGIAISLAIIIGLWVLSAIARVGVILALDELQDPTRPATFNFSKVWLEGKKKIVTILKIDITIGLAMLLILIILAAPVVALAFQQVLGGAILLGLLAIALFIPLVFLSSFMKKIAVVMCALSEVPALEAIEKSYRYVIKNFKEALKMLLSLIVLGLAQGLAAFIVLIPFMLIGIGLAFFSGESIEQNFQDPSVVVTAILFGAIVLAVSLLLKAYFSVWIFDIWLWWTKKIGGAKINDNGEEKEYVEGTVRQALPETEG